MTEDAFHTQLRIGQSILQRNGCTERDVAYHLVARLLECSGWSPVELYFERWGNGSAPDITLIPQEQSLPVLTVEVKQTWDGGGCQSGWSRTFARAETRRADPLLQVYQQLDRIERLHARRFALLTDGRRFGSFAVAPERPDTMLCLALVSLDEALQNPDRCDLLRCLLARESYCDDNGAGLTRRLEEIAAKSPAGPPAAAHAAVALDHGDLAAASRLPSDWADAVGRWCGDLGQQAFLPLLVRGEGMQEIEKISSYETMRFCSLLQPQLPAGWRLSFRRGSGGNLNIHLFPKWTGAVGAESRNSFLFQLTPNGRTIGVIWMNASEQIMRKQSIGSPLWHLHRIKMMMREKLGPNPKIYLTGMVEKLLSLVAEARQALEQAVNEGH